MRIRRTALELEALRSRERRLLAVFPHPDDEAYGAAGALARSARDPAVATVVLCLTRGEASSMGRERGLTRGEVGELREERLLDVARILSLDGLIVGDLPDGRLSRVSLHETAAVILEVLRSLRPQVVIGHDPRGVNAHPDHIATHWALRHALARHGTPRLAMVAYPPSVAEAMKPRLLFPTAEDEIDAVLHLSEEEIDAKESALRVHEALITLRDDGDPSLLRRPPVERYDFLGEPMPEPVSDLFAGLR